ncbi:uncharacterized protein LOC142071118 [Caretta caretta]|uniref:uncharacterized protein LOC142071118 n=1 Tax=Caretta caretta TaxID=8467 RepID=UPI003F4C4094
MVTRSQAKRDVTPSSVSEPSTRAQSVLPEPQTEVVEPDPMPTSVTAVVDPVAETQPEPVPNPELAEQPAPEPLPALSPALATPSTAPAPEGTTKPARAAAADNPKQEAQPEPEIPHSAPVESGSQSMETAPSPASLPEGPSPGPQSSAELMSPASREQFQTEQEADESLRGAWTAAQNNPLPLSSSSRSRELRVCQFTAQGGDDAEWPEGVYYEGKSDGGVEEVNLSMTLGRMQRQQIQELCTSYTPMFSATPGLTERAYHSTDTGNAHPIKVQPYRVSPQAKTAIEREIQDMLHLGVIRPSGSAWASPVVLLPKPDGEIRFCMDYRKLNAVTRPDNYPMPCTNELLEKLGHAQFISTLDLTKGYWQVLLDESTKESSAFVTHV